MRLPLFLITCLFSNICISDIEVEDDFRRAVILSEPAKRIAALSPHLAELVFEAGAGHKLVATVEQANFPFQVVDIPKVGSHNAIDVERLVSYKPDIVFAWYSGTNKKLLDQLNGLGLTLYYSEPDRLSDISDTIRDIGKLSDTVEVAHSSASNFDASLKSLKEQFSNRRKLDVFIQVWQQPLITLNGQQMVSRVIELCGGNNIFADENVIAPVINTESLLARDPEVIIGTAVIKQHADWMNAWLGMGSLLAVKKDNLYFIKPDLLSRQTSRMLQGAKKMCEYIDIARQKKVSP